MNHFRFKSAAPSAGIARGAVRAIQALWQMEDAKEFACLMMLAILWSLGWAALLGYCLMFFVIGAAHFKQSRPSRNIIDHEWRTRASDATMLTVIILMANSDYGLVKIIPFLLFADQIAMFVTGFLLGWIADFMVWPSAHMKWRSSLKKNNYQAWHRGSLACRRKTLRRR